MTPVSYTKATQSVHELAYNSLTMLEFWLTYVDLSGIEIMYFFGCHLALAISDMRRATDNEVRTLTAS